MRIKLGALVLLAFGLQTLVIYAGLGQLDVWGRVLFVLSYLLLFVFVWANRRHLGLAIIGVGLLLNFLPIASNGGLMPVSPQTAIRAGVADRLAELRLGDPIPGSKNVLLDKDDTRLQFLSDTLVLDNPVGVYAYSVGDMVIAGGLLVTLAQLLPRPRRSP
ncbi:MAG: DUF5317 domain-containing protein, partial [Dehalococcoidia bacterium]